MIKFLREASMDTVGLPCIHCGLFSLGSLGGLRLTPSSDTPKFRSEGRLLGFMQAPWTVTVVYANAK